MENNFTKNLRRLWHDFYYFVSFSAGEKLAMTCREATEKMDLPKDQTTFSEKFRVLLHVSVCQACSYYKKFTLRLRKALKTGADAKAPSEPETEKLNRELLARFANRT